MKAGYPPHSLTLIPELPIDSLGLKEGEQLIVTRKAEAPSSNESWSQPTASVTPSSHGVTSGLTASQGREPTPARPVDRPSSSTNGPDYVETEGGFLTHRVRFTSYPLHLRYDLYLLTDCSRRQLLPLLIHRLGV